MTGKAGRFPHQLSGGEQQRAAIAVGLANKPPLLLADEPTGELDTENADNIFQMIRGLSRSYGVTVVTVTHYQGVSQFVDRVVHIRDGRIGSETFSRPDYRRDGETVAEGVGANALGDPLNVLEWTANHLSALGDGIKAGEVVSTGTCTGVTPIAPGETLIADFGTLGCVEVRIIAA